MNCASILQRAGCIVLALAVVLELAACGSEPPVVAPGEEAPLPRVAADAPHAAFEKAQQERALSLTRQGRLADAAVAWEVLSVLRPESSEYRERLSETRRQIDEGVADHLQRAEQARKHGDLDGASAQYLAVVALQPEHGGAADALRAIERERNKRNYLGKRSRFTLSKRGNPDIEMAPSAAGTGNGDRNDVEHASMLAAQGEFDEAIAVLERHLATSPHDTAARQTLSDIYFQKADKLGARQKAAALAALQRSLKLDSGNTRAAALLKELKGSESR